MRFLLIVLAFIALSLALGASGPLSDQIRAAQQSGNYAEAGKLYLELIASGTDSPEIRSNCGLMLHLAGKNLEALQQFRAALREKPDLAAANLFAGISEFDLGAFDAAEPYLLKARQLEPGKPTPQLALGKLYLATHHYSRAKDAYERAVTLDPAFAEAWYGLGVTDRSLAEGMLNRAALQGQVKSESKNSEVQKLLDGAVESLTRAVALEPDSARTHLLMAESLSAAGKLAEAVPEFQAAINLDPSLDAAYLGLATQYWKGRQFAQALPLLKRLLAKAPDDPESNAIMADILEHSGDLDSARSCAEKALKGDPSLIQTRTVLARIYLAKKEPQLAIAELRKVIAADPDGSYHFLLYRAYSQAGDEASARQAMAAFQQLRYGASR